jgi:uncharacterized protein (DUF2164 family)
MSSENDSPMRIRLSDERRTILLRLLTEMYRTEFDEELSSYRAQQLLEFFVRMLGPQVYNQAIQDARGFMLEKLEDLDAEYYEPEDRTE